MQKTHISIWILSVGLLVAGCGAPSRYSAALDEQKALLDSSSIDISANIALATSPEEAAAMEFLYAYMPLGDIADYSGAFMLGNVQTSLRARRELPWGKSIPDAVFRHFVLPVRINNENLDSFRIAKYDEIAARVQHMDMAQAALEVNHWCHEKVNYRGTDGRTSAPLSTMSKTFGRCGEESTFTVAALRAVCIPARQVYTPRWAHTDDNHAWVEVWIDGAWKYMGACEPEPRLNRGWFDEPAKRTVLVHSRVYGKYDGTEPVVAHEKRFSELNMTANYAPVKSISVKVLRNGTPVENARVEFQLYNYAELYPIATQFTDPTGRVSMQMGLGDVIVWASSPDNLFAFRKISVSEADDEITLELTRDIAEGEQFIFDFVPPHAVRDTITIPDAEKKANGKRLAHEDSLRNARLATFPDYEWSRRLAAELNLPADKIARYIRLSYGNWQEIEKYLRDNCANPRALSLLEGISQKDFSDTKAATLTAHLEHTFISDSSRIFTRYVLAPRIHTELLTTWRQPLHEFFSANIASYRANPALLADWVKRHIRIDDKANLHSRAVISPAGVLRLRVSDAISRDVFFVAACRASGIPARLNPTTFEPEYYADSLWRRAAFTELPPIPDTGFLVLESPQDADTAHLPQYNIHFSIGKRNERGNFPTLEYPFGASLNRLGTKSPTGRHLELETGDYCLVTGNRQPDGTVLSSMQFFRIRKGETTAVTVSLRQSGATLAPLGNIAPDSLFTVSNGKQQNLFSLTPDNATSAACPPEHPLIVAWLAPDSEPSKHILHDLAGYAGHFRNWTGQFVFLADDAERLTKALALYALPDNRTALADADHHILNTLAPQFGADLKNKLPVVLYITHSGDVYYFTTGYRIGVGEQLLKIIGKLR
ncbi:MAG: transglutaminase-like domain-containing protein [Bacteroidales bacterium]|jgi:transglutaminase-like putative cysteine protease|nr:transglutaminase-like domain-containing protein [Bacteroidales bacterium]